MKDEFTIIILELITNKWLLVMRKRAKKREKTLRYYDKPKINYDYID